MKNGVRIRPESDEALNPLQSQVEPLGVTSRAAAHFIFGATPLACDSSKKTI